MRVAGPRRRGGHKPRDVGTGVVCASFGSTGAWLSLAGVHPRHGFVELTGIPMFDEDERGDPAAVRRYRALMTDAARAFLAIEAQAPVIVSSRLERPTRGDRAISQSLVVRTGADQPLDLRVRFRGRLDRPALAMITEPVAPGPRPSPVANQLVANGLRVRVVAPELDTEAAVEIEAGGEIGGAEWRLESDDSALLELAWPPGVAETSLRIRCRLVSGAETVAARRTVRRPLQPAPARLLVPGQLVPSLERIRRRALRYVRECTALHVAPGRVAILTDHRLLPLSWTRDAYWQALLLLRHNETDTVGDHLRWLWLDCRRPGHTWARSHHPDGRRADDIYQADQQLYPLLELADYRRAAGGLPELTGPAGQTWPMLVQPVLEDLGRRLSVDGLLATDENAADDPVGLPYVLANQLLAWHALTRLAEVPELGGLEPSPSSIAHHLAAAIDRHFTVDGPEGAVWAYAVDARGRAQLHHDANDVPTVLAPLWSLCAADDPRWRQTVDFAFSPANPAWVAGRFGGLGSPHTPGVWSLGLVQEWVVHSLTGRHDAAADALRRLVACAMADWSLPEASDPDSGRVLARHWFAWPGALLGALLCGAD